MSKERALLARVLTSELWSVQEELQAEIKKLLAQPEQESVYQKLSRIEDGVEVEILPSELWLEGYEVGKRIMQPKQEPEAWILEDKKTGYRRQSAYKPTDLDEEACNVIPLYTAPPKREPLSDEEIYSIGNKYAFHAAVREIERIHGIGRISNLSMSFQRVSTVLILEMRINSIKIIESNQPMTPEQKIKELYVGRVVEYHRPHYPNNILYVHIVRFKDMCGWTLGTGIVVNNLGREHTIALEEIRL